jgi:hypothetical protein
MTPKNACFVLGITYALSNPPSQKNHVKMAK